MSTLNTTTLKRDTTYDFAKGIGMLLVMFAHVNYMHPAHTLIYSFHMPLFFVISGMLFNAEKYRSFKTFLFKRIKSLWVPYLLFALVSLLMTAVLLIKTDPNGLPLSRLLRLIAHIGLDRTYEDLSDIRNPALWFLPCLFVVEVLYYWVNKIKHPLLFSAVIGALVVAGWVWGWKAWRPLPWNLRTAIFAIGFYAIGNRVFRPLMGAIRSRGAYPGRTSLCVICAVLSAAALVPIALTNGAVGLGSSTFSNGIMLYETGLLGTVFVFALSLPVSDKAVAAPINYIGRNSLLFMGVHCLWRAALYIVLNRVHIATQEQINLQIGYTLLCYVLLLGLSLLTVILINVVKSKLWPKKQAAV